MIRQQWIMCLHFVQVYQKNKISTDTIPNMKLFEYLHKTVQTLNYTPILCASHSSIHIKN